MTGRAGVKGRVALPVAVLAALGAGAALAGDKQPREYLDEQTAATITVVAEPLLFALPRPELAANVRDYVTLAADARTASPPPEPPAFAVPPGGRVPGSVPGRPAPPGAAD